MKRVVFTGGHHTSSLEVAKVLKDRGWEVFWFGHRHSMWGDKSDSAEYQDVTSAGIKFYLLKAGKLYNTFNPLKLLLVPVGFIHALLLLLMLRPQAIVSFGGYLAVPTVIAGWILGIKSMTHEQTVVSGWANKVIALFASKIAVTWPSSLKVYPTGKTILTGLPTAIQTKTVKPGKKILLVIGGKQGSHKINTVVFNALPELIKKFDEIWHQTGTSSIYADLVRAKTFKFANYHPFGYSRDNYLNLLPIANVVISRSGAHTVYDLGLVGTRSVLVPIAWASHQEQLRNAQMLERAGLAIVLPEEFLTPENLMKALTQAVTLDSKPLALPQDATSRIVQLVELLVSGNL